jgi:SAM-dependent methyltransferase
MDPETIETLLALNRRFYTDLAAPFSASRPAGDPALATILPHIPGHARLLDVGCGNGRLARLLDRERPGAAYTGVDWSPAFIEPLRASPPPHMAATFHLADVTRPGWTRLLPAEPYDCAVLLAVLQHIPSLGLRAQVLQEAGTVVRPAGVLLVSAWQFLERPRMRRKVVPWEEAGIAAERLEPGDYLLRWERGGHGRRYCHLLDEAELQQLAAACGWRAESTWRAGGCEGDLGLYAALRR